MKVGVLQFFGWRDRSVALEDIYARAMERIEIMDQTGYDAVWLAEHHFSSYSVCPSVHLMGMQVAARTKNLRIGTAVTLAAFYHPLRIAEEIAHRMEERGKTLTKSARGGIALGWLVLGALVAQFGLIALIARGYGTLTWVFIAIYVVPVLTIDGGWTLF